MSIRRILRNRKGLTLIEVLLSITILGIIATSFLSFFNQAYSYTKKNEDKTVGINVARNVLNYFEQQDFDLIKDAYLSDSSIEYKDIQIDNCDDKTSSITDTVFSDPVACKSFFTTKVNNVDFLAHVKFTRDIFDNENPSKAKPNLQEQLIGVEVKVDWNNQTTTVRGLIKK